MPRNPSELARLEEEREEILNKLRIGYHSKSTKDRYLAEVRAAEKRLGIKGHNYNSDKFGT